MNKIILLLLFTISLYSDAKSYLGLNYGQINEKFSTMDAKASSEFLNLKVGYGLRETYAVEFNLEYAKNKSKVFSSDPNVSYDGDRYSVNIELVKAFDLDIYVLPFIKAGFGAGYLKVDRTLDNRLSFGSFNIGTGFFIPISDNFDFEIAYKYKTYSYEALDLISTNIVHKSNSDSAHFGFNIRY